MAIPQFISQGTGWNGRTNTTGEVIMPADVQAGDLAILAMLTTISALETLTHCNTITFDAWVPVQTGADTTVRIHAARRICTGTEDSAGILLTATTGAAGGRAAAQVYLFRGDNASWNFEGPSGAEYAFAQQLSQVQSNIGVSTSGNERLLINIWGGNTQDETTPPEMTNDTGGTWTSAAYYFSTTTRSIAIQLFVGSLTTSGSISNGVATLSANTICNKIGVALWTTPQATPINVSPSGATDATAYGLATMISPVW